MIGKIVYPLFPDHANKEVSEIKYIHSQTVSYFMQTELKEIYSA